MSYRPNVPQSSDFISLSQRDFKRNYTTVSQYWGSDPIDEDGPGDHVSLVHADETKQGKHKKTSFVSQDADPTPAANECDLYSKDVNDIPELHYIRNGDASGNQLTDAGGLTVGGLVLRAFVLFDTSGQIIKQTTQDEDGDDVETDIAFNIDSITVNGSQVGNDFEADYTINFTNDLPDANYVWVCQSFNNFKNTGLPKVQIQPKNDATYSNTVTASSFRMFGFSFKGPGIAFSPRGPILGRCMRMMFQAYSVT